MKKPGTSSTGKSGLGSMGKAGLGSSGKSSLGSIGKSGLGSSKSTSSGKSGLLGSSGKSGGLSSTSKSGISLSSKSPISKSALSSTSKSGFSPTSKSSSSTPKPSKSFDFIPSGKPTSLPPTSYKPYSNPKSGKSTAFGIIWIPTKKRNKNKDIVLSTQNKEDRRRERSPSFYKFMSGDTSEQPYKKKEEEDLLVLPDRKLPIGTSAAPETTPGNTAATSNEDKEHLIGQGPEDSKEASGDTLEKGEASDDDDDKDYLHNDGTVRKNLPDTLTEKDAFGDKVDSVYLRPPPPHKVRSNTSNTEEESCGMKCLYYTLQCCDCVLM